MSEQSEDKIAWAWYDLDTLELKHVGFDSNADHGLDLGIVQMHYQSALDIAAGKSRLFEYELVREDDELFINYRKKKVAFKKFWQLFDPEKSGFGSYFDSVNGELSPVLVRDRDDRGFSVDVVGKAKNIVFYITMRNDPTYLIKKIELYPYAVDMATTIDIKIPVNVSGDYSIYVRYDAA